jgi:hypothetical protein
MGFTLRNAQFYKNKQGQGDKGLDLHYFYGARIDNVKISDFYVYGMKVGDDHNSSFPSLLDSSTLNADHLSISSPSSGCTSCDTIVFEENPGVSATTDIHINGFVFWGPYDGSGYICRGCDLGEFMSGYFEVNANGKGLYTRPDKAGGLIKLEHVVIEGNAAWVLGEHSYPSSIGKPHALEGRFAFIGLWKDGSGKTWDLATIGVRSMNYKPFMRSAYINGDLQFGEDDDNYTDAGSYIQHSGDVFWLQSSHPVMVQSTGDILYLRGGLGKDVQIGMDGNAITMKGITTFDNETIINGGRPGAYAALYVNPLSTQQHGIRATGGGGSIEAAVYGSSTSNAGIEGYATTGSAILGKTTEGYGGNFQASTTGQAVHATSVSGVSVWAEASSGTGMYALATTGTPATIASFHPDNNTAADVLNITRYATYGVEHGVAGIGSNVNFKIENAAGNLIQALQFVTTLTTATGGSETSQWQLINTAAGTPTVTIKVKGSTINFPALQTFADNAAAAAGGLVAGDLYRTSTGTLMVTY